MSDDTRNLIIDVAGPIFAEKGYEEATVRDICGSAGVNVASINYHFGDKESLYLETVKRAHQIRLQQVPTPEWDPQTPPEVKLGDFIKTVLTRMLDTTEQGWPVRLLVREMFQPTMACKPLVEDYIRPQHQVLMTILSEWFPEDFPEYKKTQVSFSIIGQCLHYRVAGQFVNLLVEPRIREAHYQLKQLAEHITEFSVLAIEGLTGKAETQNKRAVALLENAT